MHEKRNNTKKQTDDSFRKVNENSRILLEPSHTLSVLLRSFFCMPLNGSDNKSRVANRFCVSP